MNSSTNNQQSILSLIFGLATILSACTGMIPIPFTGLICFPLSFIFALLALIYGIIALNQIRNQRQAGSPMAWTGILIGGIVFLCAFCVALAFAALLVFSPNAVPVPQFFQNYQL